MQVLGTQEAETKIPTYSMNYWLCLRWNFYGRSCWLAHSVSHDHPGIAEPTETSCYAPKRKWRGVNPGQVNRVDIQRNPPPPQSQLLILSSQQRCAWSSKLSTRLSGPFSHSPQLTKGGGLYLWPWISLMSFLSSSWESVLHLHLLSSWLITSSFKPAKVWVPVNSHYSQ